MRLSSEYIRQIRKITKNIYGDDVEMDIVSATVKKGVEL